MLTRETAAYQQNNLHRLEIIDVVDAIETAAKKRTHEVAWPWVVLPTIPGQPYGRILLGKADTGDPRFPAVVTQPTFLTGKMTMPHSHGQNWGVSRSLGKPHINTSWEAKTRENPFPLQLSKDGKAYYDASVVVVIPPRVIHGISAAKTDKRSTYSLEEIAQMDSSTQMQIIDAERVGETSCLHIYFPDPALVSAFNATNLPDGNPDFFIEYDMVVFDQRSEEDTGIWSGGGGAWTRRMIQFGATGDHCGICFNENDPRRENLDPVLVYDNFLDHPTPRIQIYKSEPKQRRKS